MRLDRTVAVTLLAFAVAPAFAEDLTPAQTAERCENNRARLAELTRQSEAIPLMTPFEVKRVAEDVIALGSIAAKEGGVDPSDAAVIRDLAVRYKFGLASCLTLSMEQCGIDLLDAIQKAERDNAEKLATYQALLKEMHTHEVNLVALGCDSAVFDVAGDWSSNWGTMHLNGSGTIEGTYDYQGGRIYGTITGSVLEGKWSQTRSGQECKHPELGSKYWGRLKFTFDEFGNGFTGDWSYCEADVGGGDWTGQRIPTP